MQKVVGYFRVSSLGQVDGDGFNRQQVAVSKFCQQHQLTYDKAFLEEGVSGTVEAMSRPAFGQMIEYIEKNDLGGFVVERMDRLARDLMVQEFMLAECRKRGIPVYCADRGELINVASNDGDPTRKLIRQIMGALAEWEKTMLVNKLAAARAQKRAQTGRCGGTVPYGTRLVEKAVLDFVFSLRNAGASWKLIVVELNEGGMMRRCGRPWTLEKLIDICNNYMAQQKKGASNEQLV